MSSTDRHPPPAPDLAPIRFSLRSLFVFVLLCSVGCAVVFRFLLPAIDESTKPEELTAMLAAASGHDAGTED
ncbi:MAG TPA: hypothetical protein VG125_29615 [Pirellulales bacterium]|nr:hypothetical protein [Pirellulales bacterium]